MNASELLFLVRIFLLQADNGPEKQIGINIVITITRMLKINNTLFDYRSAPFSEILTLSQRITHHS